MSYGIGRAPPAFAECALTRFEEFKADHLALQRTLSMERVGIAAIMKEIRQSGSKAIRSKEIYASKNKPTPINFFMVKNFAS